MDDPRLVEELERLRNEVEALRLANAALERQMGLGAEQTDQILRAMEAQAAALKEAHQRQISQADFTRRVMDTSSALMIVLKPDGRIRQVNRRFTTEFGAADAEIEGQALDRWLHPEERQALVAFLPQAPWRVYSPLYEHVRRLGLYAGEHRLAGHEGEYRFYWLEASLQHDPKGKEEGAVV